MNILRASTITIVALAGNLGAQKTNPAVDRVAQLYRDFAWEAVVETPDWHGHDLLDQPRAVLSRYFDDALVRLWLADRACGIRTHEICRMNFLPIWDSQDPSGTFVNIAATADRMVVRVELRHPAYTEPRYLNYRLVETSAGWRVHDISREGGDGWSLVRLLSGKP
jgi:hypothetical protein